jgi:hypothetical protein|tara:strand:+ start:366 stop:698 length:333 start_codon:yes stop_codon:yes gene_type:complete
MKDYLFNIVFRNGSLQHIEPANSVIEAEEKIRNKTFWIDSSRSTKYYGIIDIRYLRELGGNRYTDSEIILSEIMKQMPYIFRDLDIGKDVVYSAVNGIGYSTELIDRYFN